MNALGIQIRNHAQIINLWFAKIRPCAIECPRGHIGLAEATLHRAACNAVHIGQRAIAGLRGHDDFSGLRNSIGNHAAHGVIRARSAACPNAEKLLRLHSARGQKCSCNRSNKVFDGHDGISKEVDEKNESPQCSQMSLRVTTMMLV